MDILKLAREMFDEDPTGCVAEVLKAAVIIGAALVYLTCFGVIHW